MTARGGLAQIGKYPVLRKLGEGATSEVYLCHDPFNGRDVAIKVAFHDKFRDPGKGRLYRKLFVTEASLAGKLQHPHICQIYDASAEEGLHYIVMEYVPGGTLEPYCVPQALLPLERVVEIAFKCSRALEFAHQAGITHRDIKPANLLLAGDTDVKVTDFGTALVSTGEVTQVSAVGSPAYMSPEQVREKGVDHRTDIYSLGVVMYHLLAGRLPFVAENNFALIYQITHEAPDPPSAHRAGLPAALDAIVLRCLEKDFAKRYARWEELSFDLADAFRGQRLQARQAHVFPDSEKFETLRDLGFFRDFTDAELWEVARISQWRHALPGEVLMREGEPGDAFCLLADGRVKVTKKGKLLNVLNAGEPFGEMAYLTRDQVRGADVSVMEEARIISVPTADLERASESCRHKFARAFLGILAERLAMANIRLSGV